VTIRGILFDAGGVLVRPAGGRWNPRYDFESVVLAHHPQVREDLFPEAFAAGQRYLAAAPVTTPPRAGYHRAILRVLGIAEPSAALLKELEDPPAGPVLEVYPDVRRVLDELQARGIGMSVVSDTWAGLEVLFQALDIERYFAGFAISEVVGCRKPDPRMFAAGRDLLGLESGECLSTTTRRWWPPPSLSGTAAWPWTGTGSRRRSPHSMGCSRTCDGSWLVSLADATVLQWQATASARPPSC